MCVCLCVCADRARSVYLDHVGRLEGVTNEGQVNGSPSGRMGDGLVSHRNPPSTNLATRTWWPCQEEEACLLTGMVSQMLAQSDSRF